MAIQPQVTFMVGNKGEDLFYRYGVMPGTDVKFVSRHPRPLTIKGSDGSLHQLPPGGPGPIQPVIIKAPPDGVARSYQVWDDQVESGYISIVSDGTEQDLCFVVNEESNAPKVSVAKILPEGTTEACVTIRNMSACRDISVAVGTTTCWLALMRGESATFKAPIHRDSWITLSSKTETVYPGCRTPGQPGGTEQADIVIIEP